MPRGGCPAKPPLRARIQKKSDEVERTMPEVVEEVVVGGEIVQKEWVEEE